MYLNQFFDVITLAGSIADVCSNPTDPWSWMCLAGDVVDLIPCVTGVGEAAKGAKAVAKSTDVGAKALNFVMDQAKGAVQDQVVEGIFGDAQVSKFETKR